MMAMENDSLLEHSLLTRNVAIFLEAARSHSFSSAAQRLHVSQSSISQSIKSLEMKLGFRLFERDVRPLRLTHEGMLLLAGLEKGTQELGSLLHQLKNKGQTKPFLKLGMLESVGSFIGADVAKGLSRDINELEIKTGPSDRLFFALLNRELELGVLSSPVLFDDSLTWDFLFEEPWVLIFPKGFEVPSPLTWQVLGKLELPFVQFGKNTANNRIISTFFDRLSLRFSTRYKVDDTNMILKFVKAGLGWGLVQPYAASSLVGLEEVIVVKAPSPISRRKVFLVSRNSFDKELLRIVKYLLIKLMQEKIKAELCPMIPWISSEYLFAQSESQNKKEPR